MTYNQIIYEENMEPIVTLIVIMLIIYVFWILPITMILRSESTSKKEKLLWLLAALFISWFAFILFALLAPILPPDDNDRFRPA